MHLPKMHDIASNASRSTIFCRDKLSWKMHQ